MYLIECANAYLAAVQLQQKEMDYQTAFAVMMVKKLLQSHVEFLQSEELKLAEKYAEKDEKGNIKWTERGTFLPGCGRGGGIPEERRALGMTQVEDDFTVQHAPVPEKITPMQLEALEKFIVFGGEDNGNRTTCHGIRRRHQQAQAGEVRRIQPHARSRERRPVGHGESDERLLSF